MKTIQEPQLRQQLDARDNGLLNALPDRTFQQGHPLPRDRRKNPGTITMKSLINNTAELLFNTEAKLPALVARLTLALVMFPHGAQKTLGWFGGYGFAGTMGFFTNTMNIPWIFALAAILAEAVGPILLVAGLGTRLAAAALAINMVVAVLTSHLQHGFFMDWFQNQAGEGYEYHLLVLGLCAVLLIGGSGKWSLDSLINRKLRSEI